MFRIFLYFLFVGSIAGCTKEAPETHTDNKEANECIETSTDTTASPSGVRDFFVMTNTCDVAVNIAYCVANAGGSPECSDPNRTNLSLNETTGTIYVPKDETPIYRFQACRDDWVIEANGDMTSTSCASP